MFFVCVKFDTHIPDKHTFYLGFTQNIEIAIDSTILKSLVSFFSKAVAENTLKRSHHLVEHLSYVSSCAAAFGELRSTHLFLKHNKNNMNKESELRFFRRHCGGFLCDEKLELVFRLGFVFLFCQAKRK